nr:MAG TPA: hypothetical protein [Caudoviricetes sp.]
MVSEPTYAGNLECAFLMFHNYLIFTMQKYEILL